MGIQKQYQRTYHVAGLGESVQALTQASTATQLPNHGVTTITSAGSGTAANHGFILQDPRVGISKSVLVDSNSTRTVTVYAASTTTTFYGTTGNSLVFSTGSLHGVQLVGLSTNSWGIESVWSRPPSSTVTASVTPTASTVSA